MDLAFLANRTATEAITPWQYFIVDDFLPPEDFDKIQNSLCSVDSGFSQLEDDEFKVNFMFMPDLGLAKFFLSDEFTLFLEKTVEKRLSINETSLVQLRLMDSNSPKMPPHVDSVDQRSLVCLYYLSPNWSKSCGGELLLHPSESEIQREDSVALEPRANRLVMFFTDEDKWHSVTKVHNWKRFSAITEWIVQD